MNNLKDTYMMPIEPELDLHTFKPRDIKSVVTEYLFAAINAGFMKVRIIHGRGTGVQRAIVQAELKEHPSVVTFWDAPESHLGATIVEIQSNADVPDRETTTQTR
jgi:dsDNA-specific endonuclease/ATPase MutS2|tara:strand:+ start:431 stop:745 length:315 start_codon:yes stop_codon:yes gene_type:complete